MAQQLLAKVNDQKAAIAAVSKLRADYPGKIFSHNDNGNKIEITLDNSEGVSVPDIESMKRVAGGYQVLDESDTKLTEKASATIQKAAPADKPVTPPKN